MSKKKKVLIGISILIICILLSIIGYTYIHGLNKLLIIKLDGNKKLELNVNDKYEELGAKAIYNKKNISNKVKIKGKVNNKKLGKYKLTYNINYKMLSKSLTRIINIVDKEAPTIKLEGGDVNIYVNEDYKEPGVSAIDNYDGDITTKIEISNNIKKDTKGEYEVVYTVKDSSGNETVSKRKVNVIEKPVVKTVLQTNTRGKGVAVLNYHFFYDENTENCDGANCQRISTFKKQLEYLKQNNFKTLTMQEFVDWIYGRIEIPDKSVLITIDDGAMGTGTHNGNKLIPILEEYKVHATLFLITGWWSIDNYRSPYLDVESHTNNMHREGLCKGVTRGAEMLCKSNNEVLEDLKTSINITNSNKAFCFPFYAYNDNAINLVKEAGFKTAFIGGGYKATKNTDKYHIPRYQILKDISLDTFSKIVN